MLGLIKPGAKTGQFGQAPNAYAPETIFDRTVPEPNSGCWIWVGPINSSGYGKVSIQGKHWIAHRAAWRIFKGKIPNGKMVLHVCDNRLCANPDHAYLGGQKENMRDMVERGRSCAGNKNTSRKNPDKQIRGSKHHSAKLTESDVVQIKTLLARGLSQKEIAAMFGVGSNNICEINAGRSWKHVVAGGGLF